MGSNLFPPAKTTIAMAVGGLRGFGLMSESTRAQNLISFLKTKHHHISKGQLGALLFPGRSSGKTYQEIAPPQFWRLMYGGVMGREVRSCL